MHQVLLLCAVLCCFCMLLHFHLHSLCFRNKLVCPQYFDDFFHIRREFMHQVLLLCAVLLLLLHFICILCAFVISLSAHSILMTFFISGGSSCIKFCCCAQYFVAFACFCTFICILCAFVTSLCAHSILMTFFISGGSSCLKFCCCAQYFCCFCTSSAFFVLSSLACLPTVFR